MRLLHVDPHRRARVVLLYLVVGREARRASRSHREQLTYRDRGVGASLLASSSPLGRATTEIGHTSGTLWAQPGAGLAAEAVYPIDFLSAGREARTPTALRPADFKSAASASSAIPAH